MRIHGGFAVLCAALVVRAALPGLALVSAGDTRTFHAPDTGSYVACATSLARGRGFTQGGAPEIARTPGYPLLLVPGVLAGHTAAVTIPLQVALGALTSWLVYRMTGRISGSPRAAMIAGMLCAFEPLSALYSGILLSETLFAAVIAAAVLLLARTVACGRTRCYVCAAIALSASAYVRPISYWLPVPIAGYLLWAARRAGYRNAALRACAFLALCAALTGAWRMRNYVETGYGGFAAISDLALYFYHGAAVEAAAAGEPYYAVQRRMGYPDRALSLAQTPGQERLSPAQRYTRMGRAGREIIRGHPRIFAGLYVKGLARTLLDPGAADYFKFFGAYREGGGLLGEAVDRGLAGTALSLARRRPALFWSGLALDLLLLGYLGAAGAGLLAWRGLAPGAGAAALTLACILVFSGGPNALARFRHPVMPLICVFAGCGIDARLREAGRKRGKP